MCKYGKWGPTANKQLKSTKVSVGNNLNKQGTTGIAKVVSEQIKYLPAARTKPGVHCIERCAERGITRKMAEKTFEKGLRYYDPKNKSIVYVLRNGIASGDHLIIAVVPDSGILKTVFTTPSVKSLPKRFIPIQ